MVPLLWAQTGPDEAALPILALQRWFEGVTLAAPESTSRPVGLWAWMLGLALMLVMALLAQGPGKCLGQLVDLPGHLRRLGEAIARLRHAGRLLVVVLGATVVSWTGYQFLHYADPAGLEALLVLTRRKSTVELAIELGVLSALTPARDVLSLGSVVVLLVPATIQMFRLSAMKWSGDPEALDDQSKSMPSGATVYWLGLGIFSLYRLVEIVTSGTRGGMPLGGCLIVEGPVIPLLMLVSDGVLVAWVLSELSRRGRGGEVGPLDFRGVLERVPAATLACLLAMPSRYIGLGTYLLLNYPLVPVVEESLKSLLTGWGLVYIQAAGLSTIGLVGVASLPGGRGKMGSLLRESGGRLVAWVALCGLGAGLASGLCYLLLLSLPPQPWVLNAADAYAHYLTLPFGLVLVSGLVGLAWESVTLAERPGGRADESQPMSLDEAGLAAF